MAITPLPTPPSRDDPANFAARGDAFLGALPDFATEANALATQVNADSITASGAASAAAAQVDATAWVSGTTYAQGDIVWSPINYLAYRRKTNGAGTTDPSADSTNWVQATGTGNLSVDSSGTSGQLLTSQGAGVNPIWTTFSSGNFGTDISFADYSITISTVLNTGGSYFIIQAYSIDATKQLLLLIGDASLHAVIFDSTTNTFGTPVLLRTAAFQNSYPAVKQVSASTFLVCTIPYNTTALETVVLSISNSTITVNTPVATTLSAVSGMNSYANRIISVGSSFVILYHNITGTTPRFRAITVSGTTPSIGSEVNYAVGLSLANHIYSHNSTTFVCFTASTTNLYVSPFTVSGTSITAGTQVTTSINAYQICSGQLSNNRYAITYSTAGGGKAGVITISGTTATLSTAAPAMTVASWSPSMQVFANQAFILTGNASGDSINVLTDTSGTATLGTSVAVSGLGIVGYFDNGKIILARLLEGSSLAYQYGILSNSPSLEKSFTSITTSTSPQTYGFVNHNYAWPLANSTGNNYPVLRTATGKIAPSYCDLRQFTISYDGVSNAKVQQGFNPYPSSADANSSAYAWAGVYTYSYSQTAILIRRVRLS